MPNVSPYELYGNNGSTWVAPTSVSGNDGSWEYGFAVYYHNGTDWVEVWNARPQVVSTSMATTSTGLTFSGTADPNNFATTAKFEYKEVGAGSYSNSGTTTTGMGDGVDGAVSYTVTATVADTYKNWESRASGTNAGGTGTGSTVTLDCRKHDAGGSGWGTSDSSNSSTCNGCGAVVTRTYTKSGCQQYSGVIQNCGTWSAVPYLSGVCYYVPNGTYQYAQESIFGWFYYTSSSCSTLAQTCASGSGGIGPSGVEQCSVTGTYRVVGPDQCYIASCC